MGEDDEVPRDAKLVRSILRSMGVEHHEPRVVNQFLDLWYRYVVDVLGDAQTYSEHAGKPSIDRDDVKLAIQSRVNFSFSQPPPREVRTLCCRYKTFFFFFFFFYFLLCAAAVVVACILGCRIPVLVLGFLHHIVWGCCTNKSDIGGVGEGEEQYSIAQDHWSSRHCLAT